jgi:hypothetical protein
MFTAEIALVRKEVLTNLRGRRPYLILVGVFLVAASTLYLSWPDDTSSSSPLFNFQEKIYVLTQVLLWGFMILTNLFIPGMCGAMFTQEREEGTYDLLRGTLLTPARLILGKLFVVMFFVLVVFSTSIPLLATLLLTGQITGSQIFKATIILFMTCLLNTLCCLFASFKAPNSAQAIRKAGGYTFLLLCGLGLIGSFNIYFITGMLSAFLGDRHGSYLDVATQIAFFWNGFTMPFYALFDVFYPSAKGSFGGIIYYSPWMLNPLFFLVCALYRFGKLRRYLDKEVDTRTRVSPKKESKKPVVRHRSRFISYLIAHNDHPIVWRELRFHPYGERWARIAYLLLISGSMVLGLWICASLDSEFHDSRRNGSQGFFTFILCLQFLFVSLLPNNNMVASLSKEINHEDFDMLRSTLITPAEYLKAKFKAFFHLCFFMLVPCFALNYCFLFFKVSFLSITLGNLELLFIFLTFLSLCLVGSTYGKKVSTAIRFNNFIFLLFSIGIWAILALMASLIFFILGFSNSFFSESYFFRFLSIFSPYFFFSMQPFSFFLYVLHLSYLFFCSLWAVSLAEKKMTSRWIEN